MLRVKLASLSRSPVTEVTNAAVFVNAVLGTHVIKTMLPLLVMQKTANVFAATLVSHPKVVQLTNTASVIRLLINIVGVGLLIQRDVN